MNTRKKHLISFACFGLAASAIIASVHFLPGGEIYAAHDKKADFHIIEISAKDLPQAFFGTSFHLLFNPEQFEYSHFSLGSYFSPEENPLVQVAQRDNAIIAGISLKRGSVINKKEGSLLKLFFRQKTDSIKKSSFSLKKGVFSTFEDGRKDLPKVKFSSITISN